MKKIFEKKFFEKIFEKKFLKSRIKIRPLHLSDSGS